MKNKIYRILDKNHKILYTGGNSWMSLDEAKKLVNRENGEMIYQYSDDFMHPLWEIL